MLGIGDIAPSFSATTSHGSVLRLEELRGTIVVLYFFPRAFTPGCTQETRRFRDNYDDLRRLGVEVIGVSTDNLATQCKFAKDNAVTFPLIGDADSVITTTYGVKWPLVPIAKRVTFVIDADGIIRAVFHHELQVLRHLDQVVRFVEQMQQEKKGERA